jgi:hypothetical protein
LDGVIEPHGVDVVGLVGEGEPLGAAPPDPASPVAIWPDGP